MHLIHFYHVVLVQDANQFTLSNLITSITMRWDFVLANNSISNSIEPLWNMLFWICSKSGSNVMFVSTCLIYWHELADMDAVCLHVSQLLHAFCVLLNCVIFVRINTLSASSYNYNETNPKISMTLVFGLPFCLFIYSKESSSKSHSCSAFCDNTEPKYSWQVNL